MLPDVFLDLGDENTPTECMRRCREEGEGFAYAGVQYAKQCYCANAPPPLDIIVDESECDMKCSGDQGLICGGVWRMNLYETGKGRPPMKENVYFRALPELGLMLELFGPFPTK